MSDFYKSLSDAIRYSMDTVDNLLPQLASRPDARLPQPEGSHPASHEPHLFRSVVSDALRDAGRHTEADLLADPNQHVVVDDGRVRAGRLTPNRVSWAMTRVEDAAHALTDNVEIVDYLHRHHTVHLPLMGSGEQPHHTTVELAGGPVDVPPHRLGATLADSMGRAVGDYGGELAGGIMRDALNDLRNAPYEEVDRTHPSEVGERVRQSPFFNTDSI